MEKNQKDVKPTTTPSAGVKKVMELGSNFVFIPQHDEEEEIFTGKYIISPFLFFCVELV